jgi:hypothetical protein
MYDIEAIVTVATPTELKLKANWPLVWLQAHGSIEIQRQLLAGETWGHRWLNPFSKLKLMATEQIGRICELATG